MDHPLEANFVPAGIWPSRNVPWRHGQYYITRYRRTSVAYSGVNPCESGFALAAVETGKSANALSSQADNAWQA